MADDDSLFTEVTETGWGNRLGNSLSGIVVGFILFVIAFPLLFWNEGRAVSTARSLDELGVFTPVSPDKPDVANDKKLIHVTGPATTGETLGDEEFGVSASAIRLRRNVEAYQYQEREETRTEKELGGKERKITVYHYDKVWSTSPIDSSRFKDPNKRGANPSPAFGSRTFNAGKVTMGGFSLTPALVGQMEKYEKLDITPAMAEKLPAKLKAMLSPRPANSEVPGVSAAGKAGLELRDGMYCYRADAARQGDQIGDLRITFQVVKPQNVSILAQQMGNTFGPFATKAGQSYELLSQGTVSGQAMIQQKRDENNMLTWILRGVGTLIMGIGLSLIGKPLSVLADVIPFLGSVVGAVTGFAAALAAVALSLVTISIAWIVYRPVLGVSVLVGGIALMVLSRKLRKPKAAVAQT